MLTHHKLEEVNNYPVYKANQKVSTLEFEEPNLDYLRSTEHSPNRKHMESSTEILLNRLANRNAEGTMTRDKSKSKMQTKTGHPYQLS